MPGILKPAVSMVTTGGLALTLLTFDDGR